MHVWPLKGELGGGGGLRWIRMRGRVVRVRSWRGVGIDEAMEVDEVANEFQWCHWVLVTGDLGQRRLESKPRS